MSASKQSVFDEALARLQIPQDLLNRGHLTAQDVYGKPFEWMCTHAANNPGLRMTANSPKDWQTPPPG